MTIDARFSGRLADDLLPPLRSVDESGEAVPVPGEVVRFLLILPEPWVEPFLTGLFIAVGLLILYVFAVGGTRRW